MNIVEPRLLKGFRDFAPNEMAKRNHVERILRSVFESYGYGQLETPVLEHADILLGKYGNEGDKLTYRFKDNGDRDVAMRYDQTVPFARFVAQNLGTLVRPFKRYQIGSVFRADKPQKGRYRQFTQCDIDIIGSNSVVTDVEVLSVAVEAFRKLGVKGFQVQFSDRKFLESVLDAAGVTAEDRGGVIVEIDKVEKIGTEKVLAAIADKGVNERGLQVIRKILGCQGSFDEKIGALEEFDVERVKSVWNSLKSLGFEMDIVFNPSLARGLDYYTGIITETVVPDSGIGSVCGGGRYDNLLGTFSKEVLSGIGIAFGLDRIIDVMETQGLFKEVTASAEYLVTVFDQSLMGKSLEIAGKLRESGASVEVYLGNNLKIAKQFKYAERAGINKVVLVGEDEVTKFESEGILVVKDMNSGEQEEEKV